VKKAAATSAPSPSVPPVGNDNLKPERSQEWELGFDAGFFKNRANLESPTTTRPPKDALILRNLRRPAARRAAYENLGKVTNKGLEGTLSARLVDGTSFAFDLSVTGSITRTSW
jgi:outer membrane receptor protein involved in Fe transport